jgi:catechol 2,3-dioxygenase-like lactoylglutathione lyase family enzyme
LPQLRKLTQSALGEFRKSRRRRSQVTREEQVFSKINHVAIVSDDYAKSALFYQAVFGMRTSEKTGPSRAQTVGDGYVGLNINPRRAGRRAGLDHFGIEVEDSETAFERMREKYPRVKWLKRPSNRPFAGISTHDPDGNMFDISQKNMTNRTSVYRDQEGKSEVNPRHINHVALRTMRPDEMAEFYRHVFELVPTNKGAGDRNHYLSDGHMTLVVMPWDISDYEGTGIITAGMDHIGFAVESLEKFKEDVDRIAADNPLLAPSPVGSGAEGKALLDLFRRSCPLGQRQMADCDGVLIDVAAA